MNNYTFLDAVKKGPYSTVYRAVKNNDPSGKFYAVKIIHKSNDVSPIDLRHEAEVLSQLKHPHISELVESGSLETGEFFIAMNYIEGVSLDAYIHQEMPFETRLDIIIQIVEAVDHIHSHGLLHRDLKPENIIITEQKENKSSPLVNICDFGFSSNIGDSSLLSGSDGTTFAYTAPELLNNISHECKVTTDLYALGVTFYEILSGKLPFSSLSLTDLCKSPRPIIALANTNDPGEFILQKIIYKLLKESPELRYQSTFSLLQDLRYITGNQFSSFEDSNRFVLGRTDSFRKLFSKPVMIGRQEITESILKEALNNKAPRFITISGHSGAGKSVLLENLIKSLQEQKYFIITVKNYQYVGKPSYNCIRKIFDQIIFIIQNLSFTQKDLLLSKLKEELDQEISVLKKIVPNFVTFFNIDDTLTDFQKYELHHENKRLQNVILQTMKILHHHIKNLIIAIDDTQWLDHNEIQIFSQLFSQIIHERMPACYLLSQRSDAPTELFHLTEPSFKVELKGLTKENIKEILLKELKHFEGDLDGFCQTIWLETDGNAIDVISTLKNLIVSDVLCYNDLKNIWVIDSQKLAHYKQHSQKNIVTDYYHHILPNTSFEILKLASILGFSFPRDFFLDYVCFDFKKTHQEVNTIINDILHLGVLELDGNDRYKFQHIQMQLYFTKNYSDIEKNELREKLIQFVKGKEISISPVSYPAQLLYHLNQLQRAPDEAECKYLLHAGIRANKSQDYHTASIYLGYELEPYIERPVKNHDIYQHYTSGQKVNTAHVYANSLVGCGKIKHSLSVYKCAETNSDNNHEKSEIASEQMQVEFYLQNHHASIDAGLRALSYLGFTLSKKPLSCFLYTLKYVFSFVLFFLKTRISPNKPDQTVEYLCHLFRQLYLPSYQVSPALTLCTSMLLFLYSRILHRQNEQRIFANAIMSCFLLSFGFKKRGSKILYQALELARSIENHTLLALLFQIEGGLLLTPDGKIDDSIKAFRSSIYYVKKTGEKHLALITYQFMAENLYFSGHLKECLEVINESFEIGKSYDVYPDTLDTIKLLKNIVELELGIQNKIDMKEVECLIDLSPRDALNISHVLLQSHTGKIFHLQGQYSTAIYFLRTAMQLFERLKFPIDMLISIYYHYIVGILDYIISSSEINDTEYANLKKEAFSCLKKYQLYAQKRLIHIPMFTAVSARVALVFTSPQTLAKSLSQILRLAQSQNNIRSQIDLCDLLATEQWAYNPSNAREFAKKSLSLAQRYSHNQTYQKLKNKYIQLGITENVQKTDLPVSYIPSQNNADDLQKNINSSLYTNKLIEACRIISSSIDLNETLVTTVKTVKEICSSEKTYLLFTENYQPILSSKPASQQLRPDIAFIRGELYLYLSAKREFSGSFSIIEDCVQQKTSILYENISQYSDIKSRQSVLLGNLVSVICVPIFNDTDEVIGVLYLDSSKHFANFNDETKNMASILVSQLSVSIENANLHRELQLELERTKLSEQKFKTLFEQSNDGIVLLSSDTKIIRTNKAFCKMLNKSEEEILQFSWNMLQKEPGNPSIQEKISLMKQGGNPTNIVRLELFRYPDTYFSAEISLAQITGAAPNTMYQLIVRDISDQLLQERYLQRHQKIELVETLSAGITHDMKNLALIVQDSVKELLEQKPDNTENKERISWILEGTERVLTLSTQLSLLTKISDNEIQRLFLNGYFNMYHSLMCGMLGFNIQLEISIPTKISCMADPSKLIQIITNMMMNSRDAMNRTGIIKIRAYHKKVACPQMDVFSKNPYTVIEISDTGKGIEPDILPRIFDPYFTTKKASGGTGLGLAVSQSICRSFGGFIDVESQVNKGTTFFILIPSTDVDFYPANTFAEHTLMLETQPIESSTFNDAHEVILLADDDHQLLQLIENSFRSQGINILTAKNGEEALELFLKNKAKITISILDINMPDISGFDVYTSILSEKPNMKVFFITGLAPGSKELNSFSDSDVTVIHKPFSIEFLIKRMQQN